MQSKTNEEFQEIAKKIVEEEQPLFDSIQELEKTGKARTKKRMNFTIDKTIAQQFKKLCKENGYNMSGKIEKFMEEFLREKKE